MPKYEPDRLPNAKTTKYTSIYQHLLHTHILQPQVLFLILCLYDVLEFNDACHLQHCSLMNNLHTQKEIYQTKKTISYEFIYQKKKKKISYEFLCVYLCEGAFPKTSSIARQW